MFVVSEPILELSSIGTTYIAPTELDHFYSCEYYKYYAPTELKNYSLNHY
jgi:hypothetical protein